MSTCEADPVDFCLVVKGTYLQEVRLYELRIHRTLAVVPLSLGTSRAIGAKL